MRVKILAAQVKELCAIIKSIPVKNTVKNTFSYFVLNANADDNSVEIKYNQGLFCLAFKVDCIVKLEGDCVIPQDVLNKICSTVKSEISIDAYSDYVEIIGSEGEKVTFQRITGFNFEMPTYDEYICNLYENEFEFLKRLTHCKFQAGKKELCFGENGFIHESDGYHIVQLLNESSTANGHMSPAISPQVIPILLALFKESCELRQSSDCLCFKHKNNMLCVKFFPCTTGFNKTAEVTGLKIDVRALKKALATFAPVNKRKGNMVFTTTVKMETNDGVLHMSINSNDFFSSTQSMYTQSVTVPCEGALLNDILINLNYFNNIVNMSLNPKLVISICPGNPRICNFSSGKMFARAGLISRKEQ